MNLVKIIKKFNNKLVETYLENEEVIRQEKYDYEKVMGKDEKRGSVNENEDANEQEEDLEMEEDQNEGNTNIMK